MIAARHVHDIVIDQNSIQLRIDGRIIKIPLEMVSKKLMSASEFERNLYKVSPSGYGIHWPLIDEDLSVDALMKAAEQ